MVARLRSISKQIHWSSLLKAAVFGAAWFLFPFWAFVLIAFYLYFIPWFTPGKLAVPFLILLVLAYIQPSPLAGTGFLFALIFGTIFYCILLVKDLLILDRRSMYEMIVLALAFFLLRDFYMAFNKGIGAGTGTGGAALFSAFLAAAAIALLFNNFIGAFADEARRGLRRTAAWLSLLLVAQVCVIGLFLPLDFTYQSIIVFLIVVLIVDLGAEYLLSVDVGISKEKVLGIASAVFTLLALVMASARWGL